MRYFTLLLLILLSFQLYANQELIIFAGAGLKRPLNEIGKRFEKTTGIKVIYDFEGTGRLGNKIILGNRPDIFIPGSEKWAKILINKNIIKKYKKVAYHIPVFITQKSNKSINNFLDLLNNKIALGDKKACAIGKSSEIIFKKADINIGKLNILSYALTANQLVLWVENGDADESIVWYSDVRGNNKIKIINIPKKYNDISIIPICNLNNTNNTNAFINFLLINGRKIFIENGYTLVTQDKKTVHKGG